MINYHPPHEYFYMTFQVLFCEVKLLFNSTEQIIQTSFDAQTEINFIQVLLELATQFTTKMGAITTYPEDSQVMPTDPLM